MSQLGAVGVGLSVAFALFMLVLALELYYAWRSRRKRWEAEVRYCGTQVKQEVQCASWRNMVAASGNVLGAEGIKRWAKLRLHSTLRWRPSQTGAGVMEGMPAEAAQAKVLEECKKQEAAAAVEEGEVEEEEEEEEQDMFKIGGLWGPPRLLFTIKEETKEEMELEEGRSGGGGKGSRRGSRASSELLFVTSPCSSSPFATPPSSPPFATPCGSPTPPLPLSSSSFCKQVQDVESSSSSTSSSSPPRLSHRLLCALFEDTSSFSSSSSAATPAALSPTALPPSSKKQRHPLCLLLDPPPAPTSALYHYHNRVFPLTSAHPVHCQVHIDDNALTRPMDSEHTLSLPFSSFHLPALSQPTTPCPFRALMNAKSTGFLRAPTATVYLAAADV